MYEHDYWKKATETDTVKVRNPRTGEVEARTYHTRRARAHRPDSEIYIEDRREFLKIKLKSLMAEARMIKAARSKTFGRLAWEMNDHRTGVLRRAARATHLAYGLIRGRTHEQMEPGASGRELPMKIVVEVDRMVRKYGPRLARVEYGHNIGLCMVTGGAKPTKAA